MTPSIKPILQLAAMIFILGGDVMLAQEDQHVNIQEALAKLRPMIGNWSTAWKFHRGAETVERVGTDSISDVLDHTYLQWTIERHPKEAPGRSQSSLIFTTFDPVSNAYVMTHFYKGSSLRVTANGGYDEGTHQLRTTAFIPREDGVRDENVRAIIDLSDPNRLVYTHYSRYNDETRERLD